MSSFLHEIEEVCFRSSKKPSEKRHKADHSCGRSHYTQYLPNFYIWSTSCAFLTWLCGNAMSFPALLMSLSLPGVHTRSANSHQGQKLRLLWGEQGARALFWVFPATAAMSFLLFCLRAHGHQHSLHFVKIPCTENPSVLPFLHWSHAEGTSTSWIMISEQYFGFWALLYCSPLPLCILNSGLQYCPVYRTWHCQIKRHTSLVCCQSEKWSEKCSYFFNDSSLRPEQSKPHITWGHIFLYRHTICWCTSELRTSLDIQIEKKHLKKCSKAPVVWHRNTSRSILNTDRYRPEMQLFPLDHTWPAASMRVYRALFRPRYATLTAFSLPICMTVP